ncbi:5-deoxy-glucuronate isomerase [Pseudoxanthomonas sangjuensis]|uniref:5-deoxy-glucuronate isomerase n=1 Tax=Pseudoxanthomonas sangjuensis TaxID=1503750 RepID=UPI0013915096|nr:5-deoxy-glucuronate isomerase [Pseudoxanthomonas sangjuensis]KAF1715053.1 5-deoxy-glucuronate isomerase [Pseudoxanthomonas sangjuensis]
MSSRLHLRPHAPTADGTVLAVTPDSAGWTYIGQHIVRLADGQRFEGFDAARETCLVLVTGSADVVAGEHSFVAVGGRATPFEDRAPGAVYVPAGTAYSVVANGAAELVVCTAPGKPGRAPRLIDAAHMPRETRGQGTNTRYVRNILPEGEPADSLLVVEVITPAGHWSSYPPHKHDTHVPGKETALEETYYHRITPAQGFAFQRVYTAEGDLDESFAVGDGDMVLVPRGYHPVGAAHGYDLYYLNVMAGPERRWMFCIDPDHLWILSPPK